MLNLNLDKSPSKDEEAGMATHEIEKQVVSIEQQTFQL